MKILVNERLSQHKYKTPEGYLVCVDSVLARTGKQTYRRNEIFLDSDDDSEIEVDRTPEEVFAEATLASFENKPITLEHPDEDVNIDNYKDYAIGFVRDVKRGVYDGQDVILGTLVFTDAEAIKEIEDGTRTELSCGYDCDIEDEADPQQKHIRGNHVALCEAGRAGIAKIIDSIHDVDNKIDKVRIEYDRHQKLWCACALNKDGDVISNYVYGPTKQDVKLDAQQWKVGQITTEVYDNQIKDAVKPEAKGYYKGYEIIATNVGYGNAKTQVDIYEEGTKRKFKSYFTGEEDLDKAIEEAKKYYMKEVPLTKKQRDLISNYLNMVSGFVRRKDTDIQDVIRPLQGKGFKPYVDKVEGWIWKKNQYAYKNYYMGFDGYTDHFLVQLYADPEQDWDTKEVNAYFTDSVVRDAARLLEKYNGYEIWDGKEDSGQVAYVVIKKDGKFIQSADDIDEAKEDIDELTKPKHYKLNFKTENRNGSTLPESKSFVKSSDEEAVEEALKILKQKKASKYLAILIEESSKREVDLGDSIKDAYNYGVETNFDKILYDLTAKNIDWDSAANDTQIIWFKDDKEYAKAKQYLDKERWRYKEGVNRKGVKYFEIKDSEKMKDAKGDDVIRWWKEVERWNGDNGNPFNIDNDYNDMEGMIIAIPDMTGEPKFKKLAPQLAKQGEQLYKKYKYETWWQDSTPDEEQTEMLEKDYDNYVEDKEICDYKDYCAADIKVGRTFEHRRNGKFIIVEKRGNEVIYQYEDGKKYREGVMTMVEDLNGGIVRVVDSVEDSLVDVPESILKAFEKHLAKQGIRVVKKGKGSGGAHSYWYDCESDLSPQAVHKILQKLDDWLGRERIPMTWNAGEDKYGNTTVSIDLLKQQVPDKISLDSINDVTPNAGESKEDFIARFMKETKNEYPDIKQRLAVAYSYWKNKGKDSMVKDFDSDYAKCVKQLDKDVDQMYKLYQHGDKAPSTILKNMGYKEAGTNRFVMKSGKNQMVIDFDDNSDYIKYYVVDETGQIPRGWTSTKMKFYDSKVKDSIFVMKDSDGNKILRATSLKDALKKYKKMYPKGKLYEVEQTDKFDTFFKTIRR